MKKETEKGEKEKMNALVELNEVKRQLALATKVEEVKEIRDRAETLREYAKKIGAGLELQNYAAEIKIRAERRVGEAVEGAITEAGRGKTQKSVPRCHAF